MTSPEHEPLLPRVEEDDLLSLVIEDITDPTHERHWKEFAAQNPHLAAELLKRTFARTRDITDSNRSEVQKFALDTVTFAMRAMEQAAKRYYTSSGDVGDAVPQPST
ncbi:MAG TPA: hypothetical protein VFH06_04720 [Candidatus Saccharimonadales bacterium]|nr:hypothetical protein [Candidatus Saccharimonadales bacterium]